MVVCCVLLLFAFVVVGCWLGVRCLVLFVVHCRVFGVVDLFVACWCWCSLVLPFVVIACRMLLLRVGCSCMLCWLLLFV